MNYLKNTYAILLAWRLIPHLLLLLLHSNRSTIWEDVSCNSESKPTWLNFIRLMTLEPTFRNLFYYRLGKIHWLISWLCPKERSLKVKADMPIGKRARFVHNHTTYLNAASIGDDFECLHLVTIGAWRDRLPVIGNRVRVYCGAMILGDVKIGNHVNIGAGAVVTKNVPDHCTVVGNPARIVKLNGEKVDQAL